MVCLIPGHAFEPMLVPTQPTSSYINKLCHCSAAAAKVVQSHLGFSFPYHMSTCYALYLAVCHAYCL